MPWCGRGSPRMISRHRSLPNCTVGRGRWKGSEQVSDNQGELRYTEGHEWVRPGAGESGGAVRVGSTGYAQGQRGELVVGDLRGSGRVFAAGEVFGESESTKSVSELFMPVSGEVVVVNDAAGESPELLNSDPFGEGWLIEIAVDAEQGLPDLLTEQAYQGFIAG